MGDETVTLWRPGIPYQKWLMMQQDLITEEEKEAYRKEQERAKKTTAKPTPRKKR